MHELGMIQKIVDNAAAAATKAGLKNVKLLRMRIGKMAGFEPDQLQFLFDTYEKPVLLSSTKLEIEEIPVQLLCKKCGHKYIDHKFDDAVYAHEVSHTPYAYRPPQCPQCGSNEIEITHGKELELVDLEGE